MPSVTSAHMLEQRSLTVSPTLKLCRRNLPAASSQARRDSDQWLCILQAFGVISIMWNESHPGKGITKSTRGRSRRIQFLKNVCDCHFNWIEKSIICSKLTLELKHPGEKIMWMRFQNRTMWNEGAGTKAQCWKPFPDCPSISCLAEATLTPALLALLALLGTSVLNLILEHAQYQGWVRPGRWVVRVHRNKNQWMAVYHLSQGSSHACPWWYAKPQGPYCNQDLIKAAWGKGTETYVFIS